MSGKEERNNLPLISVIIPVYNVEKYISECIESILGQTYKELEIILVDDGSSDNSSQICDEYGEKDERIKVIHKENGGLSDARNTGMSMALGGYLIFVDSDDYMVHDGIEYLYNLMIENNAQLVIGGVEKFRDDTKQVIANTYDGRELIDCFDKQEAMKDMFLNGCASWARLYKKEIHDRVLFPKGEINEDEAIMLHIIENCEKVVKTNRIIYRYRYRPQSITSTSFHKKKLAWYEHCKANLSHISSRYPDLIPYAEYRYCSSMIWCLNNMTVDVKTYREEIKRIRQELKKLLPHVRKTGLLRKKEKIRAYFLLYFYSMYAGLIKILHKHYT